MAFLYSSEYMESNLQQYLIVKTKLFPCKTGKKSEMSSLTTPIHYHHGRQEKEINCIRIGKDKIKLPLFSDNMIVYVRNTKGSTLSPTKKKKKNL